MEEFKLVYEEELFKLFLISKNCKKKVLLYKSKSSGKILQFSNEFLVPKHVQEILEEIDNLTMRYAI